jgi:hypothetical protein
MLLSRHQSAGQNHTIKIGNRSYENGEKRNAYRTLLGKPEGRRSLGGPRRRCVDNIKMVLREIGWGGIDWIDLAQDRDQWRAFVNTVMNLLVPLNFGKFLSSCTMSGFSGRAELHELSYCSYITLILSSSSKTVPCSFHVINFQFHNKK